MIQTPISVDFGLTATPLGRLMRARPMTRRPTLSGFKGQPLNPACCSEGNGLAEGLAGGPGKSLFN